MSKEKYINKLQEFIEIGDIHLIAVPRFKEFMRQLREDFPEADSDDRSGTSYWHTTDIQSWLDKWFGETK